MNYTVEQLLKLATDGELNGSLVEVNDIETLHEIVFNLATAKRVKWYFQSHINGIYHFIGGKSDTIDTEVYHYYIIFNGEV